MNKNYFVELVNYNIWADTIAMEWLKQINDEQWHRSVTSSFNSIRQTAIHIASAEKVWIDFWENKPHPVYLSSEFDGSRNSLLAIWRDACVNMKRFFDKFPEDQNEQQVTFQYPRGGEGRMPFWQTFSHIINHSTYHRGQLVTLLRQVGFTEFSSIDLATYYRLCQKRSG